MRVRQLSAAATAALVAGAGLVMAAPPAAAASVTVSCASSSTVTVTAAAGETIFVTETDCGSPTAITGPVTVASDNPIEISVNSTAQPGTYAAAFELPGGAGVAVVFNLIVPAATIPIPAWVQAYGRPGKDATCLPGWGPSWQQWAVASTGGWVCTRTIPSLG